MSTFHRFIQNASWNIAGKVFAQAVFFVISIMVSRYLGKEGLGLYATVLVAPVLIRWLNTLGLEGMLNKKLPELNLQDPSGAAGRYLLRRVLWIRLASTLLCAGLMAVLLPAYAEWAHVTQILEYRPAIVLYFVAVALNSMLSVVFMTLLRFRVVSITDGINALCNVFLLALFILLDWGLWGVLWAYIISTFIQIGLYLYLSRRMLTGPETASDMAEARHLAWVVYGIYLLSLGLWTQSDVLIMNLYQVPGERIGYYHLATSLGAMVIFILAGIGQLSQSLYTESYTNEGKSGLSRVWKLTLAFSAWITLPIGVFAFCYAEPLVTLIFGNQYAPVALVFRFYVVFVVIAAVLGSDLNNFALFVLHRRNSALWISVEGSVWNLILDVLWIPQFGEIGAALATGSVMVYMVLRQLFVLRDAVEVRSMWSLPGQALLVSLAALVPPLAIAALGWHHVLLHVVLYMVSLMALLLIVKPLPQDIREEAARMSPQLGQWAARICR